VFPGGGGGSVSEGDGTVGWSLLKSVGMALGIDPHMSCYALPACLRAGVVVEAPKRDATAAAIRGSFKVPLEEKPGDSKIELAPLGPVLRLLSTVGQLSTLINRRPVICPMPLLARDSQLNFPHQTSVPGISTVGTHVFHSINTPPASSTHTEYIFRLRNRPSSSLPAHLPILSPQF